MHYTILRIIHSILFCALTLTSGLRASEDEYMAPDRLVLSADVPFDLSLLKPKKNTDLICNDLYFKFDKTPRHGMSLNLPYLFFLNFSGHYIFYYSPKMYFVIPFEFGEPLFDFSGNQLMRTSFRATTGIGARYFLRDTFLRAGAYIGATLVAGAQANRPYSREKNITFIGGDEKYLIWGPAIEIGAIYPITQHFFIDFNWGLRVLFFHTIRGGDGALPALALNGAIEVGYLW